MLTTRMTSVLPLSIGTACYNSVESAKLLLERGDIKVNIPGNLGAEGLRSTTHAMKGPLE